MIEDMKVYLMERWAKNRKDAERLPSQGVLPKIRKRLEKEFKESDKWLPRWAGEKKYELHQPYG
ncbi:Sporozoite surface protein 2 [Senna tora]|uniref:Sporozoite surface protein 2 n=1 Tax=Senna tora TaxID=362788 RepID=A0A834W3A9_9FABA|nr:Sporozoite surface protein 2 [Senna tora]